MTTRRRFLARAAAGVALAGAPALIRRAGAAEPLRFITPFGFDSNFIEVLNAYANGHWTRQGLDSQVIGGTGTVQAIQAVLSGTADVGMSSGIDFIRTVGAKDAPLVAFGTIAQKLGFSLVSLPDKPIKSGADLRGKTIGILSLGGTTETLVDMLILKAGVAKSEVKLVVAGNSPGEIEFIRQGRIDCFLCTFTAGFRLKQTGAQAHYLAIDDVVETPGTIYWVTRETLAKRPDFVTRVLRGLKTSADQVLAGPLGPLYQLAGKDFEIPGVRDLDAMVALQQAVIAQLWLAEGKENLFRNVPTRWQACADALHGVGLMPAKDAGAFYSNAIVDAVKA